MDRESARTRESRRTSTDTSFDGRSITSQSDARSYRERLKDRINIVKVSELAYGMDRKSNLERHTSIMARREPVFTRIRRRRVNRSRPNETIMGEG